MTPYLPPCKSFRKVLQKTNIILQETDKTHSESKKKIRNVEFLIIIHTEPPNDTNKKTWSDLLSSCFRV